MLAIQHKRRKRLGHAIEFDDPDVLEVAKPDDRDRRKAAILASASGVLAAIWAGKFTFNAAKLFYSLSDGRKVTVSNVRAELEKAITVANGRVKSASDSLIHGEIILAEWQEVMRDEIRATTLLSVAVASGGVDDSIIDIDVAVGEIVQTQIQYLNDFASGIEDQSVSLDGRLTSRSELYTLQARPAYYKTVTQVAKDAGILYVERVRYATESCPDCIDWEGFWRIEDVPPIGSSVCLSRCHCAIEPIESLPEGSTLEEGTA